MAKKLPPIHPGEILSAILQDAGLSTRQTASALRIPVYRLTSIITRKRPITADTAMRLGRFFGTSAEMWINLQSRYDLHVAEDKLSKKVAQEVKPFKRVA